MNEQFSRTGILLGAEAVEKLANARVAVFGLHADDLIETAKTAKELNELGLLQMEVFFVGEVLQRAASAFFCVRAGEHGEVPFIRVVSFNQFRCAKGAFGI